jgi:hypothetical protein
VNTSFSEESEVSLLVFILLRGYILGLWGAVGIKRLLRSPCASFAEPWGSAKHTLRNAGLRDSVSAQGREGRGFDSDPGRKKKAI